MRDFLDTACEIALRAHTGQLDKGGAPYICHPVAVALGLDSDASREAKAVALLHDVIEDTDVMVSDLYSAGLPVNVVVAVEAITRRYDETRAEYLDRVMHNELALQVKLADLRHNMQITRIEHPQEVDVARCARYKEEYDMLLAYYLNNYKSGGMKCKIGR